MSYVKGDYTRCYEDICEIWHEDNLYCIVRTDDADKIVEVLNENEQLKSDINLLTDQYNNIFEKNEQLKSDIKLHIDDSEKYRELSIQFDNKNKELITKNALLEKENEQLKQTIQEYYETTNADGKQIISDLADLIGMRLR